MKLLYMALGFLSLGLGIIGIVLPLLPTTPFLLLTAFFFARSSEKFHDWLLEHPYFGKTIKDWQETGSINKKAKIAAMFVIGITIMFSLILKVPLKIFAVQLVILSAVTIFILTRPSDGKPRKKKIKLRTPEKNA